MTVQTYCIVSFAVGLVILNFTNEREIAMAIAAALLCIALARPNAGLVVRRLERREAPHPDEVEQLRRRLY